MNLADVLRQNAARKPARQVSVVNAESVRKCLLAILSDAMAAATHSGNTESCVFLEEKHAPEPVRDHIKEAVANRRSSSLFEDALKALEEASGVGILVALTGSGAPLFIFGREDQPVSEPEKSLRPPRNEPSVGVTLRMRNPRPRGY